MAPDDKCPWHTDMKDEIKRLWEHMGNRMKVSTFWQVVTVLVVLFMAINGIIYAKVENTGQHGHAVELSLKRIETNQEILLEAFRRNGFRVPSRPLEGAE